MDANIRREALTQTGGVGCFSLLVGNAKHFQRLVK